jgi:hypothetical protein
LILLSACLAGACVRAVGEPPAGDASTGDVNQAADTLPPNPWLGSFTIAAPEPLTALNSAEYDMEPSPSADGLTLHFARGPTTLGYALYRAARAHRDASFKDPAAVTEINSATDAATRLFVAADNLTGYLSAIQQQGLGGYDLWLIRRESPTAPFDPKTMVNLPLNSAKHDWDPFVTRDGLTLYYCISTHPQGAGQNDLMVATRSSSTELFSSPKLLVEINTSGQEGNPTLTDDGLVLVFNSNRPGSLGSGDLWYATRESSTDLFSDPKKVPGINSSSNEGEPFISGDGRELYFSSDRPGGRGGMDIYAARIVPQ